MGHKVASISEQWFSRFCADRQTDRQTDRQMPPETIGLPARSMRAANKSINLLSPAYYVCQVWFSNRRARWRKHTTSNVGVAENDDVTLRHQSDSHRSALNSQLQHLNTARRSSIMTS